MATPNCAIYPTPDNHNNNITTTTSSASMGTVCADIGSLSLNSPPSYGVATSSRGFAFVDGVLEGKSGGSDCSTDGFEETNESINHSADCNEDSRNDINNSFVKETDSSGQSKLCARGHWRPAEDTKLKELIALYGPQNWNLIAEKLEGRSGNCAFC